jgi:hypothetical protein
MIRIVARCSKRLVDRETDAAKLIKPRALNGAGLFQIQRTAVLPRALHVRYSERCGFNLFTFEYSLFSAEI